MEKAQLWSQSVCYVCLWCMHVQCHTGFGKCFFDLNVAKWNQQGKQIKQGLFAMDVLVPTKSTKQVVWLCDFCFDVLRHWYHWICKQGMSQVFMEKNAIGYGRPAWTQQLCRLLTKSNYFVVGHARRVHRCHLHPLFHHLLWPQWIQWCPKLIKLLINLYCYFFWNQSMMRCDNCDMCDIVWHIHCK